MAYKCSVTAGDMLDAFLSGTTVLLKFPVVDDVYKSAMQVVSVDYKDEQDEFRAVFTTRHNTFYAYSRDEYPTTNDSGGSVV